MYSKLNSYDVVTILYCSECDENKDYDEIETNDSRITTTFGSYTRLQVIAYYIAINVVMKSK